jgi:hypothetical protein
MANLGRKITSIGTLNSFTAKVVYDASTRYGTAQANQTFQVGYEYTGSNFFKSLNRPPKLRILSIFQPLLSGNPNASNDTYVAFQVYDYTLSAWRGPWCKRANQNASWTYVDYFVTTIDSFGRKYGNYYTGANSIATTFTPPTALFSQSASLSLTTLAGRTVTAIAGHNPSAFVLGGSTNKLYHFHGFLTLAGYSGTWCFYSISANGAGIGFNHLLDVAPYNTGTYPNVLPATNKLASEWRLATFCNIDNLGYSPRIRINSTGLGPVKAYFGQDPGSMFPNGVDNINVFEAEVWCTYDPGDPATFFLTPLWSPGGSTEESEQGVEGTQAANYAPAGWYGTSAENSYAYWDGLGAWTPNSYATYQVAPTSTEFTYYGFYQSQDPMEVCSTGPQGLAMIGYYDTSTGFDMMTQLFSDSLLQNPISTFVPNRFYYNQTDGVAFSADPSARVQVTFKC